MSNTISPGAVFASVKDITHVDGKPVATLRVHGNRRFSLAVEDFATAALDLEFRVSGRDAERLDLAQPDDFVIEVDDEGTWLASSSDLSDLDTRCTFTVELT